MRSPPLPLCFVVFLPPIASMQVFNDSLCAGHVSSCCLGCRHQRSAALRHPHHRTQAFELEGQLQVAPAFQPLSLLWPPRLASPLHHIIRLFRGQSIWQPPLQLMGKNISVCCVPSASSACNNRRLIRWKTHQARRTSTGRAAPQRRTRRRTLLQISVQSPC